ncbi:MAG: hypothetical protein ACM3N5_10225, partial [Candidatus Eiseniibacteriota bacterium]
MSARRGHRALLAAALLAAVAAGALSGPRAAVAQGLGLENQSTSKQPVTIEAEDGIEWHQQEKLYLA